MSVPPRLRVLLTVPPDLLACFRFSKKIIDLVRSAHSVTLLPLFLFGVKDVGQCAAVFV